MNDNKQVLKYCPNFYKIINFKPLEEDTFSMKIINMYRQYIFKVDTSSEEEISKIRDLDDAIIKYINDFSFRNKIQDEISTIKVKNDCKDLLRFLVDAVIKIFKTYQDFTTRIIYVSRWI